MTVLFLRPPVLVAPRVQRRCLLVGKFAQPLLCCARSLASRGVSVFLMEEGRGAPGWKRYSRCLKGGAVLDPDLVGTDEGIQRIREYATGVGADVLIPGWDFRTEWLVEHRTLLAPMTIAAPSHEALSRIGTKEQQIAIARDAGFQVLPTWYLRTPEDCRAIEPTFFPVVLRPSLPSSVNPQFKVKLAANQAEIQSFMASHAVVGDPIVAQPFLHLPNLLIHCVRGSDGTSLATESFLVPRKFLGTGLTLERTTVPNELLRRCRYFAERASLTGVFHFDLLYDPTTGITYFLEVNARLGGTTDKVYRLGFDEPSLLLEAFGISMPEAPLPAANRVVSVRDHVRHIVYAARGRLTPLDYPHSGRVRTIVASLHELMTARDAVFEWSDLRGSLWYHLRVPFVTKLLERNRRRRTHATSR